MLSRLSYNKKTMGQALYRKYRSKKLSEIVGQEHITTTLENALKAGRISHAYLFTGPKGVGKTSIARILAHEVNGLPYEDDNNHIDIIEIDAASNRRIDEIRDLREKVHVAPAMAKYKVYIIDEVHMLTREAFNALLKTLEEPPAHVIFILATTEAHKLPDTIISRTQRYTFKPVDEAKVVEHLKFIAKQEHIKVSDDALKLIAQHGEGSFRDSISLLDQASSMNDSVELANVQTMLGIAPTDAVEGIYDSILQHNTAALTAQLQAMREQGFHPASIAKQLGSYVRRHMVQKKMALPLPQTTKLLHELLRVPSAHDPETYMEIILLDAALSNDDESQAEPVARRPSVKPNPAPTPAAEKTSAAAAPPAKVAKQETETLIEEPVVVSETVFEVPIDNNNELWGQLLASIKRQYNTLYGVLRMAQPAITEDTLVLKFGFPFHQKRINEDKNRRKINEVLQQLTNKEYDIEVVYVKNLPPPNVPELVEVAEDPSDLNAISNIFGGAEVL